MLLMPLPRELLAMVRKTPGEKTRELHQAYASDSPAQASEIYDGWSGQYEQHMQGVGYAHPAMVAAMLARLLPAGDSPILEAGTGTGILGGILSALGYTNLTGFDASQGMLAHAKARNIYQELHTGLLGERLAYDDDRFVASVASGVFTEGHAPLAGLDELVRVTRPGGHVVFTISRTFLGDAFAARERQLVDADKWRRVDVSQRYDSAPLAEEVLLSQAFAFTVL